ncbi:hypothetical protein, partial [Thalassobaculum salexigens]|uniref:hypothetical protein n=1 Tax=Thalassobaculum salexigens TaxID=455360 RepID=UPI00248EC735
MKMDTPQTLRMPPDGPIQGPSRRQQSIARFLTMLLLGLALQSADPFNFLTYTERKTLDLFSFVMGPELRSDWNEEMAVVLIDGPPVLSSFDLAAIDHFAPTGKPQRRHGFGRANDCQFQQHRELVHPVPPKGFAPRCTNIPAGSRGACASGRAHPPLIDPAIQLPTAHDRPKRDFLAQPGDRATNVQKQGQPRVGAGIEHLVRKSVIPQQPLAFGIGNTLAIHLKPRGLFAAAIGRCRVALKSETRRVRGYFLPLIMRFHC